MVLQDLVPTFYGEDKVTECKMRLNCDSPFSWLKTVDAFANTDGGSIYFGVKDKTYELAGYTLAEIDDEKTKLFSCFRQYFPIRPNTEIELLPYQEAGKTRYCYRLIVYPSSRRPIPLYMDKINAIFVRDDAVTRPATLEEITTMALEGTATYDTQVTDIPFSLSDFTKLNEFYAERHNGASMTEKGLRSIGFMDEKGYLKQGSYLFSDHYAGTDTKIFCSLFPGITRGEDVVTDTISMQGNLIDECRFVMRFVEQHMNHGFRKTATGRVDIVSYPSRALFEATINALAHRDYLMKGTQISVEMFRNRLVVTSPGPYLQNRVLNETRKLSSFASSRRNELISAIFVYCNAMEAKGTGFEKIEFDYRGYDEIHQPFIFSRHNQFCLVLPDLTNPDGVVITAESIEMIEPSSVPLSSKQWNVLSYCYESKRTAKEIADSLSLSSSSYFRESILKPLIEQNLLKESKKGNATTYLTNREKIRLR